MKLRSSQLGKKLIEKVRVLLAGAFPNVVTHERIGLLIRLNDSSCCFCDGSWSVKTLHESIAHDAPTAGQSCT